MKASSEYRKALSKADAVIRNTHRRFREIRKEGRSEEWTRKAIQDAATEAKQQFAAAKKEMQQAAWSQAAEAKELHDRAVRRADLGTLTDRDATMGLLFQKRVDSLMAGADAEQAIERYRSFDLVDSHERRHKYLLDEALTNALRGTDLEHRLDDVLDAHRTVEERVGREALRQTLDFCNAGGDASMRGFLDLSFAHVMEGREPAKFDGGWEGVLGEMEQNMRQPYGESSSAKVGGDDAS